MLEKIVLSITITFSLYLSFQTQGLPKTPTYSAEHLSEIPERRVNLWY